MFGQSIGALCNPKAPERQLADGFGIIPAMAMAAYSSNFLPADLSLTGAFRCPERIALTCANADTAAMVREERGFASRVAHVSVVDLQGVMFKRPNRSAKGDLPVWGLSQHRSWLVFPVVRWRAPLDCYYVQNSAMHDLPLNLLR